MNRTLFFFFWLSTSSIVVLTYADDMELTFRIEIMKDSIVVGEPLIVKCWLINNSRKTVEICGECGTAALVYGNLDFYLSPKAKTVTPYTYKIGKHVLAPIRSLFTLDPYDSTYWYNLLWLENFQLNKKELGGRSFCIFATAGFLVDKSQQDLKTLTSAIDYFVVVSLPVIEKEIFNEWTSYADEYFSYGDRIPYAKDAKKFHDLCIKIAKSDSRLAYYAHYIASTLGFADRKTQLLFLEKYPNTPLAEMLEFGLNKEEAMKKYPRYIETRYLLEKSRQKK